MKKIEVRYQEPGGIIWKVLPDEEAKHLVIESRDGERRRTLLSVFSMEEKLFLAKEIPAPKPWWIGLKAVGNGKAIFQGYKESQTPEPKGVYVTALSTGQLSWQDEEKIFHSFADSTTLLLSAREDEQEVVYEAVLSTGQLLPRTDKTFNEMPSFGNSCVFPLLYSEENIYYKTIVEFIQQNGYKNVGPIEYLEYAEKILLSFYIQEGKKLINILLVADEEGNILLEDPLTEGAEGIGMSSFFIGNGTLIYIKNKTSLALAALI